MNYKLPRSLRVLLAKPQGELFTGEPEISIPKAVNWMKENGLNMEEDVDFTRQDQCKIICVGDVVSKAMLEHPKLNKFIKMCFVDGNTQRGDEVEIGKDKNDKNPIKRFSRLSIENPREHVNESIFKLIREKINDEYQYIVNIIGEEDLIVLPATIESYNDFIFYGQPPITALNPPIEPGCVGILSDESTKQKFQKVLDMFEKII